MTAVFFLGFSAVFILLGIAAAVLGKGFAMLQSENTGRIVTLAGIALIALGALTFLGKGFSGISLMKGAPRHDVAGVFLFGMAFAVGWSACIGPILAGVLVMASVLENYLYAALLLFFYSLGIFVPLFLLALAYDRTGMGKRIQLPSLSFRILSWQLRTDYVHMAAGLLLAGIGAYFLLNNGTVPINAFDMFGLRDYFYSLQRWMLGSGSNALIANLLGGALLLALAFLLLWPELRKRAGR